MSGLVETPCPCLVAAALCVLEDAVCIPNTSVFSVSIPSAQVRLCPLREAPAA